MPGGYMYYRKSFDEKKHLEQKSKHSFNTILYLLGMAAYLILFTYFIFGLSALIYLAIAIAVFYFVQDRVSYKTVIKWMKGSELTEYHAPQLYLALKNLAKKAGLDRMPKLYYIPGNNLNAFSMGSSSNSAVALSDGIIQHLSTRELTGVLAHEISHIKNNDLSILSVSNMMRYVAQNLTIIGYVLVFIYFLMSQDIAMMTLLVLILSPIVLMLLHLGLSRTREFDADVDAVKLTEDPEGLALALKKIERIHKGILSQILMPNYSLKVPSVFNTHPPTMERIERLMSLYKYKEMSIFDLLRSPRNFRSI